MAVSIHDRDTDRQEGKDGRLKSVLAASTIRSVSGRPAWGFVAVDTLATRTALTARLGIDIGIHPTACPLGGVSGATG